MNSHAGVVSFEHGEQALEYQLQLGFCPMKNPTKVGTLTPTQN